LAEFFKKKLKIGSMLERTQLVFNTFHGQGNYVMGNLGFRSETRLSTQKFFLTNSLVGVSVLWQLAEFLQSEVSTLLFPLFRTHLGL